jgi:hypothetical protein
MKQLYEEALADVRKVKEIAEADAKRAVLEAVTPRIRDLIEQELLREQTDDDVDVTDQSTVGALATDSSVPNQELDAISQPDEEGKVTLDLDALCSDDAGVETSLVSGELPGQEYELNLESIAALTPVLKATKVGAAKELELSVYRIGESIQVFSNASRLIRESKGFHDKIAQMISRVEDMYDYVQESIVDSAKKSSYETKLESYFTELNKLREQTMSQKSKKKMMNEEDVTLKLTGLPDDIDLDSVGVDLITGEDGEGDEASADEFGDETSDDLGGGDDEGGDDFADLDLGGEEDNQMGESRKLSDDTIVEIDEGMLRREIARMKKLREEALPSMAGGVDASVLDDFGGGSDEGEPLDAEIVDLSPAKAARPLGEADGEEELDELDQMDESDPFVEMQAAPDQSVQHESLKRRAAFEANLQERAKSRAASLKKEVAKAKATKNVKNESLLKRQYSLLAKRFNESVDRSKKLTKLIANSAKKLQNESNRNGGSTRSAESRTEASLRNKLAETNLINAKLMFTNKLLQNESLSSRQKVQVIEQLDSAKTVREAKLVYESLAKTLASTSKSISENRERRVLGSSSRTTRSASTQTLNEGYEAERWARLAGITK